MNRQPLEAEPAKKKGAARQADPEKEDLRRKLRRRKKEKDKEATPDPPPAPVEPVQPVVFGRSLPRREPPPKPPPSSSEPHIVLEEAVNGAETVAPDGSKAYLVERSLGIPDGKWSRLCQDFAAAVAAEGSGLWAQLARAEVEGDLRPDDFVFLDLETTGLTSSPLFLIGTMVWDGEGLVTRQYLARNYAEERAALALFVELAAGRKVLVSFNGKTFDEPYVRMRAAANGVPCALDLKHLDLLHTARRIWRGVLPNCKLQTLEHRICGRERHGDIPGSQIPEAYHAYVRTGNAAQITEVLRHNFLDLVTMADIIVHLPVPHGSTAESAT